MNPPRRITDPSFRYTDAASTDIRKTFARIRREQAREQRQRAAFEAAARAQAEEVAREAAAKVAPLPKRKGNAYP